MDCKATKSQGELRGGLHFQNIAPYFFVLSRLPRDMICPDVTSASGPARSRRAPPGAQRQRTASRHEA